MSTSTWPLANPPSAVPSATPTAGIRGQTWSAEEGHPQRTWILAVLAAVAFMAQLDLFIVNIAVPAIGRSFGGAGLSNVSWVLNAYAIIFAALLVPAGRLADHFGRRRFLIAGVTIFTIASGLCALAPNLDVLILGRGIQAIGAAIIVPTSLGLLLPSFPKRQHSFVVGVWAGVAAVAASSGPPVGGLLVAIDWRWIFLINLPIGLAVVLIGLRTLPEIRAGVNARLPDTASVVALLAAISLLILATVQGQSWGWSSGRTLGIFLVGALSLAATIYRTVRHPNALIEASLFRSREFTTAAVALFLFFIAFSVWLLITVVFLQDVWHYSALRSGFAMIPGPITAAVFALNSGRITRRFGRAVPAIAGALFVAASAGYWISSVPIHPSYFGTFLPGLILGGAGAGLAQAPLFAAASTLAPDRATTGSAVLNMSRQVGSAVGVALLVVLLASSHPQALGLYHRGWIAEIVASLSAAVAIIILRPRRPTLQASVPAG